MRDSDLYSMYLALFFVVLRTDLTHLATSNSRSNQAEVEGSVMDSQR
jgi:hypothetical protein